MVSRQPHHMTLDQFIRNARKRRRHTVEQAADEVGVTRQAWTAWEMGRLPKLYHFVLICDYARVKLDELRAHIIASHQHKARKAA